MSQMPSFGQKPVGRGPVQATTASGLTDSVSPSATETRAVRLAVAMTTQAEPAGSAWVVMATASRTARVSVADGETLSVRPEAVVAWTGPRPTGFCPKLGIWDILLPRGPKDLLFTFHGPSLVWIEGSFASSSKRFNGSTVQRFNGGVYGL